MVKRRGPDIRDDIMDDVGTRRSSSKRGRVDNTMAAAVVITVAVAILLGFTYETENWWATALFALMFFASEYFALSFHNKGYISIGLLPVVMAFMVSGPLGAGVVALFGAPAFYLKETKRDYKRILINTCQYFIAAALAGWVFRSIAGNLLDPSLKGAGGFILPWLLAVIIFYLLNTIFITPLIASTEESLFRCWSKIMLPALAGYLLYGGIGFLSAILYVRLEFPAVLVLFIPILAVREFYTRYEAMRQVCDETTHVVMEAVERGGRIPEGHSMGVADMAVAIAREMNFEADDIHRLRQAALLHDIGKLAIDPALLNKEGFLTAEDYEEIQKHSLVGGEIVSKEISFKMVAPAIVHHHEQVDGSGYIDGLPGESIPTGAKILAVADTFDAMQRKSHHRKAFSPYDAASEIIKAKGIQFDPDVVDAFINVVKKRGIWSSVQPEKESGPGQNVAEQPRLIEEDEKPIAEFLPDGDEKKEILSKQSVEKTPTDGLKLSDIKGEIERDIRSWKKSGYEKKEDRKEE